MLMKKILLFFVTIMLSAGLGFAQSRNITGKVTDATTGEGIPFASIQVKGTMTGASADADGNYSINVKSNDALCLSSFLSVINNMKLQLTERKTSMWNLIWMRQLSMRQS